MLNVLVVCEESQAVCLPPLFSTSICINPLPHVLVRGNGSKNRSKTFSGLANAMAKQWGVYCDV